MRRSSVGGGDTRGRYLTAAQAQRVYDRIGRFQDAQAIYEHGAVADLLARADFEHAHTVFELGHGTGALAARLLGRDLSGGGRYVGIDVSPRMHQLALARLRGYAERVELRLSDGSLQLPFPAGAFDRFLSTYVLDLLPNQDIDLVLREAARLLTPDGLLCLVSLTHGATMPALIVTHLWQRVWSRCPELVGGCRPLRLTDRLDPSRWTIRHHTVVTTFAISSEVVIAAAARP